MQASCCATREPDMHDGRERPQQNLGVTAGKDEVPAGDIATPAVIAGDDAAIAQRREKSVEVDRLQ